MSGFLYTWSIWARGRCFAERTLPIKPVQNYVHRIFFLNTKKLRKIFWSSMWIPHFFPHIGVIDCSLPVGITVDIDDFDEVGAVGGTSWLEYIWMIFSPMRGHSHGRASCNLILNGTHIYIFMLSLPNLWIFKPLIPSFTTWSRNISDFLDMCLDRRVRIL